MGAGGAKGFGWDAETGGANGLGCGAGDCGDATPSAGLAHAARPASAGLAGAARATDPSATGPAAPARADEPSATSPGVA
ncbi:hypothetical protein ACIP3A_31615 [Streptomyces tricolor]|uniref:hypothetical protein n=1 Tax=Streptomyces tricolor TaxID=68277 RepID=UPI0038044238